MKRSQCIECGGPCNIVSKRCASCNAKLRAAVPSRDQCPNPSGLCECGCGQPTKIATKTWNKHGMVRGCPNRFVYGHVHRSSLPEYVVNEVTGCWEWQRFRDKLGYGSLHLAGKRLAAHRYVYEKMRGEIPDGLVLDHLCRNPSCVNPDHLEPVTYAVNSRRGASTKLSEEKVSEIRALAEQASQGELAKQFGVDQTTIWEILHRRTWK